MSQGQIKKHRDETMMLTSPFHSRIVAACEINKWNEWKGVTTPDAYTDVELEYFAIRNSTGVFDISPMTKYRITKFAFGRGLPILGNSICSNGLLTSKSLVYSF